MTYLLVLMLYGNPAMQYDAVAITTAPMPTLAACEAAGREAAVLINGTTKKMRFVCVRQT